MTTKSEGEKTVPTELWRSDSELFSIAREELYTAVVGDILDQMRLYHQFLPPQLQPLEKSMFVIGRAMTVLEADAADDTPGQHNGADLPQPFGIMLEALDDLRENEVYLCSGASPSYALWGELMSVRAKKLGAAGAVVCGYSRDTKGILEMNFPTFSLGSYAQDQAPRGKVVGFRVPLKIGEVRVEPGDIVIGDIDGVCVVPATVVKEVFTRALQKARGEKVVYKKIMEGMSAKDAFATYGIL